MAGMCWQNAGRPAGWPDRYSSLAAELAAGRRQPRPSVRLPAQASSEASSATMVIRMLARQHGLRAKRGAPGKKGQGVAVERASMQ